jgi:hypothetical protein
LTGSDYRSVYYVAFENFFTVQEATAGAERHINGGATLRTKCGRPHLMREIRMLRSTRRGWKRGMVEIV